MHDSNNQTKPSHAVEVRFETPRPVRIGDVFYFIERAKSQTFREPCKVCGGAHELTINGVTFKCPVCNYQKETIEIDSFAVRRYRVYAIEDEVDTLDWKPSNSHRVKFRLYRKIGGGHYIYSDNGGHTNFAPWELCSKYNHPYTDDLQPNDGIYDDYALAVKVAEQMTAREIERLNAYNAEYGTNHTVEFATKHDPKSN